MNDTVKILIVDDEIGVCKSCERLLARRDYKIQYTLNAEDALKRLATESCDVVITDLMMPGMSGMELLERIKNQWPYTSVIMITGYATIRSATQAIKLGAFDYIPKPFTPEELRGVTERALKRSSMYKSDREAVKPSSKEEFESRVREEVEKRLEKPRPAEREQTQPVTIEPLPEEIEEELPVDEIRNFHCIREHAWTYIDNYGTAWIGMHHIFRGTIGEITNVDLPLEEEELEQGKTCARILGKGKNIYKLWSPITGTVIKVNPFVARDITILEIDPYRKGWLIQVKPASLEEDLKNLTDGIE